MEKIICPVCGKESDESSYYCCFCGGKLKDGGRRKNTKHKYDYLFTVPIVLDDSRDWDGYAVYRSKEKKA